MRTLKMISAAGCALALAVLALASPARATTAVPNVTATKTACGVDLQFDNPARWAFSFDYRVDDQEPSAPVEAELADLLIKEGPLKGEGFGPRYQVVTLAAGESVTAEVRFDTAGQHTVAYQLRRGPEQRMFLPWTTVQVDVPQSCVPTPDPTTEPTTGPTGEPTTGPTSEPTAGPTGEPTTGPTSEPTSEPTTDPTSEPTSEPGTGGGDGGTDDGNLPLTGAAVGGIAAGAVLLLAAGATLYIVARRRRLRFTV